MAGSSSSTTAAGNGGLERGERAGKWGQEDGLYLRLDPQIEPLQNEQGHEPLIDADRR
jgi:hypothetical protein